MSKKINISQDIFSEVSARFSELVKLILNSTTLHYNDDERSPDYEMSKAYWLTQLPIISDDQRQRLFDILENERKENLKILNTAFKDGITKY